MINSTLDMTNLATGKTVGEEIVAIEDSFYEFVISESEGEVAYIGYVMYDAVNDRRVLFARDIGLVFGLIDKVVMAIFIVVAVMILVGLILSYLVASSITKPIVKMRAYAERVAKGDLRETLKVKSRDELGKLGDDLNVMVDNLRSLVKESTEMSSLVHQTTDHLAKMQARQAKQLIRSQALSKKLQLVQQTRLRKRKKVFVVLNRLK